MRCGRDFAPAFPRLYDALQEVGAWAVVEHDLFQRYNQPTGITGLADLAQVIDPRHHVAFRHAVAYENADLLMGGGRRVLKHGVQLFIELLAGAHASEFNLNVFIRPQPREQDQVSSQIDDLYRLAHFQDADLAALSDHRGLQHELVIGSVNEVLFRAKVPFRRLDTRVAQ